MARSAPVLIPGSYEDLELRARMRLAEGDTGGALEAYRQLSDRLASLSPAILDRRPGLRSLHLMSLIQQADIHHWQGDFEQAAQAYRQLIDRAPDRANFWRQRLALVHIDMGRIETGLDELRAQVVASPGESGVWLTLGIECQALGRLQEAEENLQRAARTAASPGNQAQAYLLLFDFYREQGRVGDALGAWEQAWVVLEKPPDYIFPLYQMMWEAGDPGRAQGYLDQEKNPLRKGFYQGLFAAEQGRTDEATRHWKQVAKMDPLKFDEGHEAWAEAALRVDAPARRVVDVLHAVREAGGTTQRGLLLQAAAEARLGHLDHAGHVLEVARSYALRDRPRRTRLPLSDWKWLAELIGDGEAAQSLRGYFEEPSEVPEGEAKAP
jgi:tetratricopeptide (TPR) repeat protein